MFYVYFFIAWMAGLFVFSFTIVPVSIILFFSIPYTISLNKTGKMSTYVPIYRDLASLVFLCLVYFAIIWLLHRYLSSSWLWGFVFGSGVTFVFSLGKLGTNPNNISDYMDNNSKYIKDKN